jgi:hypothetical protein
VIWLLLACTAAPPVPVAPVVYTGWTRAAALAPILTHTDTDHDGRVSRAEYDRVAYRAVPFAAADLDHDGALGVTELDALLAGQDPVTLEAADAGATAGADAGFIRKDGFDDKGGGAKPGGTGAPGSAAAPADLRARSATWAILTVLRDEVLARDPAAQVPTPEQIGAAAASGGFDTEGARQVLATLQAASEKAGLAFPPSLRSPAHR